MRRIPTPILVLPLVLVAACSISKSISSSFESSSGSSASSSRSSSPERAAAYREDVRDYTQAYVKSGGDYATFSRGLGSIASKHGVSNWEADNDTYVGIGEGLKQAGVTQMQLEVWKTNLAAGDASKAAAIQKGTTLPGPEIARVAATACGAAWLRRCVALLRRAIAR
jgi:hypothetical protein